ncbi:MAG TPA: hypothetical protein VD838_09570, partial [Anaeromyxobacteraceae bacterium]|nr:hypothetical protein [Anaeromyxobacteraceae bacterium]
MVSGANGHERGVQGVVEDRLSRAGELAEGGDRERERLAERVALDLAREISREPSRLLPPVAEEERLAPFVRVSLVRSCSRGLVDELLPNEVRERLLALRREIHNLQRSAGACPACAHRTLRERRQVVLVLRRRAREEASARPVGAGCCRVEDAARSHIQQERRDRRARVGVRLLEQDVQFVQRAAELGQDATALVP